MYGSVNGSSMPLPTRPQQYCDRIGLIELVIDQIGLIELRIGLIEQGIGLMELGIGLRIDNARRTVLAHVSGLVKTFLACIEPETSHIISRKNFLWQHNSKSNRDYWIPKKCFKAKGFLIKVLIKSWFTVHKLICNFKWAFQLKLSQKLLPFDTNQVSVAQFVQKWLQL